MHAVAAEFQLQQGAGATEGEWGGRGGGGAGGGRQMYMGEVHEREDGLFWDVEMNSPADTGVRNVRNLDRPLLIAKFTDGCAQESVP